MNYDKIPCPTDPITAKNLPRFPRWKGKNEPRRVYESTGRGTPVSFFQRSKTLFVPRWRSPVSLDWKRFSTCYNIQDNSNSNVASELTVSPWTLPGRIFSLAVHFAHVLGLPIFPYEVEVSYGVEVIFYLRQTRATKRAWQLRSFNRVFDLKHTVIYICLRRCDAETPRGRGRRR